LATELRHYLDDLRGNLKLDPVDEKEIITELEAHVEDRLQELKEAGLSNEEAVERCVGLLGSAKMLARQIYEAHSQGTWRQALLASTPHLFFALLFAPRWLVGVAWLPVIFGSFIGIVLYGWYHPPGFSPGWVTPCYR